MGGRKCLLTAFTIPLNIEVLLHCNNGVECMAAMQICIAYSMGCDELMQCVKMTIHGLWR